MTQIRVVVVALALSLTTLAAARPADACGGGYNWPQTAEQQVASVVQAQVHWLQQEEIDSVVRSWVEVDRAQVERWARELPHDLVVTALETRITAGRIAVARLSLRSGDRDWDAFYVLVERDGAWRLVHGAGLIPDPTTTAARG